MNLLSYVLVIQEGYLSLNSRIKKQIELRKATDYMNVKTELKKKKKNKYKKKKKKKKKNYSNTAAVPKLEFTCN